MTSTDIGANPRVAPSAADYLDAGKGIFDAWFTGSMVAWWDASSLFGLTDGDSVAQVDDASGRGNALTRYVTSAGNPPTKATDAVSGKAVMRFNGSQKINAASLGVWPKASITPEMTIVAIVKPSSTQVSTTPKIIGGSGSTPFSLRIHNPASTPAKIAYATGGSVTNTSLFGPSIMDDAWHIVTATVDASQTTIYQDNYEVANIGAGGNTLSTAFATPDIGDLFVGDIAEIMIFDRKLPQRYLKVLHDYLNTKWSAGLTIRNSIDGNQAYETGTTTDTSATRIFTPPAPKADAPLILWCHPQGQSEQIIPSYFAYGYVHASVAMGWYFAASSMGYSGSPGGSASSWGNPTAQTALAQLYAVMASRRSFPKVILAGASMGGLASALAIIKDTLPTGVVKGAYFIDAAFDLYAMYKTATYSPTIDSGYGISAGTLSSAASANDISISSSVSYSAGTIIVVDPLGTNPETRTVQSVSGAGPYTVTLTQPLTYAHLSGVKVSDYGTKTAGNDPMVASVAKFAGLRTRFLASSADTTVPKVTHTDAFQARIAATAAESGIVSHLNGHLGSGSADPRDFVEFVSRCLAA